MRLNPQTYILTTVTFSRLRIFQKNTNAELMIATILRYRDAGHFLLHGFVVMPDHLHIALTPTESIEKAAQLIKGGFSFAIRKEYPGEIWQPSYHAHRITDSADYRNQLEYVAQNPNRKNYLDYPYVHTTTKWSLDPKPEQFIT